MSTVDSTTSWNSFNRSVSPESIFSSPLLFGAHDNLPEVPFQLHDNDGSRYMGSDDDAIRLTEMEKDVREPHLWKGPGEVAQALATRVGTPSSAPVSACPTGIRPHELYHFKDGNIKFQIEGILYNVHRYFFEKDSSFFFNLFASENNPITLFGVSVFEFDLFLSIFYPKDYGVFTATTVEDWSAVLKLADLWGFKSIRALAIKQIAPIASAIDMIVLGRQYQVDEWRLLDAYDAVCIRPDPLTLEEGNRLGMADVIKIMAIRQEYDLGRRSFTSPPLPTLNILREHFGLPDGPHLSAPFLEEGAEFETFDEACAQSTTLTTDAAVGPPSSIVPDKFPSAVASFQAVSHDQNAIKKGPYWHTLTKSEYFSQRKREAEEAKGAEHQCKKPRTPVANSRILEWVTTHEGSCVCTICMRHSSVE